MQGVTTNLLNILINGFAWYTTFLLVLAFVVIPLISYFWLTPWEKDMRGIKVTEMIVIPLLATGAVALFYILPEDSYRIIYATLSDWISSLIQGALVVFWMVKF